MMTMNDEEEGANATGDVGVAGNKGDDIESNAKVADEENQKDHSPTLGGSDKDDPDSAGDVPIKDYVVGNDVDDTEGGDGKARAVEEEKHPRRPRLILIGTILGCLILAIAIALGLTLGMTHHEAAYSSCCALWAADATYYGPLPNTGGAGDEFDSYTENAIQYTAVNPISTFSADVDTSSYSYVRNLIQNSNTLPETDAVFVEEFINYFDYDYPQPQVLNKPFLPTTMVSKSPWNPSLNKLLLHIGIKGYDIEDRSDTRPNSNICFLVDVSGSMYSPNKLPLAIESIKLLLDNLNEGDYVSIVTYASIVDIALKPTPVTVDTKTRILSALDTLQAGGSTYGEGGIDLAYRLLEENYNEDAVNRVMLLTDGDFNIGKSDTTSLQELIEEKRDTANIYLSVLGFGMGNYRDTTMKSLANYGNGVASYIDTIEEAHKVMVVESTSTIFPIAKDVKFQIEFNSDVVEQYRLVGYEKRQLQQEDFDNDTVDAGDIGSGHTVTVIYELQLVDKDEVDAVDIEAESAISPRAVDNNEELNGETDTEATAAESTVMFTDDQYALLKIRYKLPEDDDGDEQASKLIEEYVTRTSSPTNLDTNSREIGPITSAATASTSDQILQEEFQFATAVAGFAQLLKGGKFIQDDAYGYDDVIQTAESNLGIDTYGYRKLFVQLVTKVMKLV